jgi:hypothetical protein
MSDGDDAIALGVSVLAALEHQELTVKEALDRVETVTTDPTLQRRILDRAEAAGHIERDDTVIRPTTRASVSLDGDIVRKEGEFTCRRCGASLSTGHFIDFDAGEHGPFGPTCLRKLTGRE